MERLPSEGRAVRLRSRSLSRSSLRCKQEMRNVEDGLQIDNRVQREDKAAQSEGCEADGVRSRGGGRRREGSERAEQSRAGKRSARYADVTTIQGHACDAAASAAAALRFSSSGSV